MSVSFHRKNKNERDIFDLECVTRTDGAGGSDPLVEHATHVLWEEL